VVLGLVSSSTHVNPEFEPVDQSSSFVPDGGVKDKVLLIDGVRVFVGIYGEGIFFFDILGNLSIEEIELGGVKRGHVVISGNRDNFFFFILSHSAESHIGSFSVSSSSFFCDGSESVHPNFSEFLSFDSEFKQFVGIKSEFTDIGEFNCVLGIFEEEVDGVISTVEEDSVFGFKSERFSVDQSEFGRSFISDFLISFHILHLGS